MPNFCAHHKSLRECYMAFNEFKVPRKDNSICKIPIAKLCTNTACSYVLLKKLMIRLRRQRKPKDWQEFVRVFEGNFDVFLSTMNGRWIVSMLDCYTDHADDITSRNALLATTIVNCEKMHMTMKICHDKQKRNKCTGAKRHVFASGLDTFMLPGADMPKNFFRRMQGKLKSTPIIHAMYKKLMKALLTSDETSMHFFEGAAVLSAYKHPYYIHVLEEKPPCRTK